MVEDPVAKWEEFIRSRYWDELLELADSYPLRRSLSIKFPDVDRYDPEFADELLEKPEPLLEAAETALLEIDLPIDVVLEKAHFRIVGLPRRFKTSELRSDQIGRLIALEGLVRTVTEVRPKVLSAAFECQRCGHLFYKEQTTSKFQEPYDCPNEACDRRGPFKLLLDRSRFVDAQNVRVQESPEELRGGEQPQTLDVQLEDDLSGIIYPGDRVVISGVLRSYQRTTQTGKSTYFDLFLEGNSVEMMEQEFEEIEIKAEDERLIRELASDPLIYEKVRRSIAPSIYGYEEVKEALGLQLFSGVSKGLPDGTRIRGDIHILLVGDPGIAKSQLLRYISKLSPRGIYTSGKSSTSAGLTATAVKDELGDGRWTIEAGALVLADKGIACIDEMDKMRSEDRSALHEAMEQQTISVAKAGVMATLKSRCALLAAANPKFGRFDKFEGIAQQINLSPALMSRFDLIFVLTDEPSDARDSMIAHHIGQTTYAGEIASRGDRSREELEAVMEVIRPAIEPEVLRKYIAYARKNVFPVLTPEARARLEGYYVSLRKQGQDTNKPVPVTARQLEALFRLSESSARLRLSDEITGGDAERVIRIVDSCLRQVGVDPETGLLDADVLAVGISKSTRDKTRLMIDLVRELASEHQGPAPLEAVLERAETKLGIERNKAEEIIKRLRTNGEIFEPRSGYLKLP
ncbi:MAG: minichromosome maintenance protein MCM [Methanothrix sp.]|jgi:replicative DNA helicase Mcm|nr:minichromosome maintenance protein MCM [Methanothrix sp.]OPX82369.1 MAG: Minichromosome maintenance protein MCM [Methanosaeta sp. PtaB.Bin087]NLX37990.1 minichromosome maintenance protein MCM [Methanothrix sp.]HNR57241.1 minichromosome maintenance protein MCM [Methanothrix sp.]HOI69577.1 minichromosome maintenance protein MCM [Methanothrix sp.]